MKRTLCMILALSLGVCACALAEQIAIPGFNEQLIIMGDPQKDIALQLALDFIDKNTESQAAFIAESRYAPLRAYKLECPTDWSAADEYAAKAYGAYSAVYAIHYEVESRSTPFASYRDVAVGVSENGEMAFCEAPDEIIAQSKNHQSFQDFRVTLYAFSGLDRNTVTVYLPDSNFDGLEVFEAEGQNSAVGLIFALEKAKAVPAGTYVLEYDGKTLNLSEEFGQAMTHTGTAGEYLMMGAVVNTFLKNLNLKQITVLCEGKIIETGHRVYDEPLAFYDIDR